jgi:16S rRNA (guanine966-N2)-methyltransferase
VRIVAGRHRGRPLAAPPGQLVRPTSDRARQALFDILGHGRYGAGGSILAGARVLDGFAGTGALGLEALSRGADHATFFENARSALAVLRRNIEVLGEGPKTTVHANDVRKPPRAPVSCGLIFLDPPYGQELAPAALVALKEAGWVAPGAVIVVEVAAKEAFAAPEGFATDDERVYGAARLILLRAA